MKQNRLLEDPVRSVFLSYLVPSVSATLVTSIYILADTMMIGRGIGSVGIAALNILLPLYSTFFGFGMMCGIGGSVLFGFSRGKGNEREARGYFTTGLLMARPRRWNRCPQWSGPSSGICAFPDTSPPSL